MRKRRFKKKYKTFFRKKRFRKKRSLRSIGFRM